MRKIVSLLMVALIACSSLFAQKPEFKVLAFAENVGNEHHKNFASPLIAFFTELGVREHFTFDVTSDESKMNEAFLKNYQVVIWANEAPYAEGVHDAFQKYMEGGGGWLGFHESAFLKKGSGWPWLREFLGARANRTSSPALPARLYVDDASHPVTQNIPAYLWSPANRWLQWAPGLRENKDIKVLLTLDPINYPLGIDNILTGGDTPVVWTNTKFNMIYVNMGYDERSMSDAFQNQLFADALMWLGKKSVQKVKSTAANANLPEMIPVKGGSFTMGDDAGDKDEKPAHQVAVSDFNIAKTETTMAEWRNFCLSTGRPMPEAPWFPQSEQHPVVNVSWDHALAYCKWLSDVTGKHYRLPTEAEWEFAARGGVKTKGFPYSGGKNADSVAWLGRKTEGTQPVAQKAPNELGLYDMTGNVWEWCSDWYSSQYYAVSEKENPKGPASGQFYTFRGGAWDIGVRNNRITYRNPLAPTSRNHNKGFRVVCD